MNLLSIEGTTKLEELLRLQEMARAIPENGWIIEIGSYFGRGSYALGTAKCDSVLLTCIDPFPVKQLKEDIEDYGYAGYSFADWESNMKDVVNVEAVRGFHKWDAKYLSFTKTPDLIVLDNPKIFESLMFWDRFLGPGSKIVVLTNTWKLLPNGQPFMWWTEQLNLFLDHPQGDRYTVEAGEFTILTKK